MSGIGDAFKPFGKDYDTHTPVAPPREYTPDVLEECAKGRQHCGICPDFKCGDNTSPVAAYRKRVLSALRGMRPPQALCNRDDASREWWWAMGAAIRAVEGLK